jgi:hypothetical protein
MTDWPEYNKKLVNETVDVFFSKSLLIDQEKQLKKMNMGKRGKPYMYSDALRPQIYRKHVLMWRWTRGLGPILESFCADSGTSIAYSSREDGERGWRQAWIWMVFKPGLCSCWTSMQVRAGTQSTHTRSSEGWYADTTGPRSTWTALDVRR